MAVAAAQARMLTLTMYKSDLEYRIMNISAQRQALSTQSQAYSTAIYQQYQEAGLDAPDLSNDPVLAGIQAQDSYLEQQQKTLETQQKSVTSDLESVEKLVDTNIKKDFKLNIGS